MTRRLGRLLTGGGVDYSNQPGPPRPFPILPDPSGPTENGKVPCNEPLTRGGEVVGYCERLVRWRHRGRQRGTHRGPHRLEWWS